MDPSFLPWQPNDDTDRDLIACLNFGGEMHLYASGFEHGAEALYKVLQEQRHGQDLLVYPFVYCLRHAIELALKQVIRSGRRLFDEEPVFPYLHDLFKLWNICAPLLKRIWPDSGNESQYFIVENTIRSFRLIDPLGEGFRYPEAKDKRATLHPDLSYLDLGKMFEEVKVTLNLLMGADTGIDFYMDAKNDMEAEYRQIDAEMRAEYERDYGYDAGEDQRDEW
jgi:hypothetical protein